MNKPTYEELEQRVAYLEDLVRENSIDGNSKSDEAILQYVSFLQTLIDTIPWPVFYKGVNGRYMSCNKAFEELMGFNRMDIIGKTVYDLVPKIFAEAHNLKDKELFGNPGVQTYPWIVPNSKGEIRYVQFYKSTFVKENGKIGGILVIIYDVAEQRATENDFINVCKSYFMLVNGSKSGYSLNSMIYDDEGNPVDYTFLDVNDSFEKLTGLKREDLINKTAREVFGEDYKMNLERYSEAATTGQTIKFRDYSKILKKYFDIVVYSPKKGFFAVIFNKIKKADLEDK